MSSVDEDVLVPAKQEDPVDEDPYENGAPHTRQQVNMLITKHLPLKGGVLGRPKPRTSASLAAAYKFLMMHMRQPGHVAMARNTAQLCMRMNLALLVREREKDISSASCAE